MTGWYPISDFVQDRFKKPVVRTLFPVRIQPRTELKEVVACRFDGFLLLQGF